MTERTIHLVRDPRSRDSRKIHVRPGRWYASVQLDRDAYVDAETSLGHDTELPAAFKEAADRACDASVDRIWCDGYRGNFWGASDSRRVTLFVQFPHVAAAVEALRAAELDRDYSQLHTLADRLALPVDDWLAPGERELIRGVDFDSPPSAFLGFLRGKAKGRGLNLNGRATAGSVWVRPTLSSAQKQIREMFPEQYPGWVDRWTGHVDEDDAPTRPWVGGSDQDLSYGAMSVQFLAARKQLGVDCPCGMRLRETGDGGTAHASHHATWVLGVRVPKNLAWLDDLAVVTTQSPIAWRRLAHKVARMPQRENHYDFRSWSHLGEPEVTPDNMRAYLLKANECVIGYLTARDLNEHRRWDLSDGSRYGDEDGTRRPSIDLIWVADAYRRQGVGAMLVQALAADFGCEVADVSWSSPISNAGRRLARRLSPGGIWIN